MTLVATDRYRMAVRELDWQPVEPSIRASVLVPARTLADAAKTMIAGTEMTISLAVGGQEEDPAAGFDDANGLIGFDGGGRRLTTRLLGTDFVTYKSRFPREPGCRARLAAGPFSEAIRRVALVADRESRLLLTFGAGEVVMETGSGDGSQAVDTAEAEFEGEDGFAIAFKPQYLLDGIAAAGARAEGEAGTADGQESDSKEAGGTARAARGGGVTLAFTAPDKPAVITGGPGFRYLLAPMRT
jgi:DNA polymerase III subunit beta